MKPVSPTPTASLLCTAGSHRPSQAALPCEEASTLLSAPVTLHSAAPQPWA